MMVLGGGALGKYLGHESGIAMNEISVFIQKTPQRSLDLPPCKDTA